MSESDRDPHDLTAAVQGALDAVARLDSEQEVNDLPTVLRRELARRGVEVDDDQWLAEASRHIQDGHSVVVDDDDDV